MPKNLPSHFSRFKAAQPEVYQAFEELGRFVHSSTSAGHSPSANGAS